MTCTSNCSAMMKKIMLFISCISSHQIWIAACQNRSRLLYRQAKVALDFFWVVWGGQHLYRPTGALTFLLCVNGKKKINDPWTQIDTHGQIASWKVNKMKWNSMRCNLTQKGTTGFDRKSAHPFLLNPHQDDVWTWRLHAFAPLSGDRTMQFQLSMFHYHH